MLYKLHDACGVQHRGSIALLECNGHSLEKEREGLVVMCNGLLKPANITEQTESIRAKGTRGINSYWDKMVGPGQQSVLLPPSGFSR